MPMATMPDDDADKQRVLDRIGDISGIELMGNRVLVGIYMRGDTTKSGIVMPSTVLAEDQHQGKACLVLAMGPDAFADSDGVKFTSKVAVGDWVALRVGEAWPIAINNREGFCRVVLDQDIAMKVPRPDHVW